MSAMESAAKKMKVVPEALGSDPAAWVGQDCLSTTQFNTDALELLFSLADRFRADLAAGKKLKVLEGKLLACVFMEPSTRTSCSFQAASLKLGGTTIMLNESGSSAKKGETLEDTMRCLECYADALVLRHPVKGSAQRAADACAKPILNAGDGVGEHPTQALLDVYTIRTELLAAAGAAPGSVPAGELLSGKVVTLVGDLKHGRTVHSLAELIARNYPDVQLRFVSPPQLQMPEEVVSEVASHGTGLSLPSHLPHTSSAPPPHTSPANSPAYPRARPHHTAHPTTHNTSPP